MKTRDTIKALVERRESQTGESLTAQARAMGMTQATLHRIVNGDIKNPSHDKLKLIAKFFRCTIDDLESGAALRSEAAATPEAEAPPDEATYPVSALRLALRFVRDAEARAKGRFREDDFADLLFAVADWVIALEQELTEEDERRFRKLLVTLVTNLPKGIETL